MPPQSLQIRTQVVSTLILALCTPKQKGGASGEVPACQCRRCKRGTFGPWVGKTPEGGQGNPLQYSCLANPINRGVWQPAVLRVTMS